jgi:mannan endo-1,4-beta-mannosidase
MKAKLLLTLISLFAIAGETFPQVDAGATTQTKNLYFNLKEVAWDTRGILFGQQFYNSFSMAGGNHEDESVSDFKDVTGDHPAVLGQDFSFISPKRPPRGEGTKKPRYIPIIMVE